MPASFLSDYFFFYLDIVVVSEEHGDPVNAHAPASSGWQAILQRSAEILIHLLSFIVTSSFVL
jgi:hypothetical protein